MLINNSNIQMRRDGKAKSRIARFLILTGILGAALLERVLPTLRSCGQSPRPFPETTAGDEPP